MTARPGARRVLCSPPSLEPLLPAASRGTMASAVRAPALRRTPPRILSAALEGIESRERVVRWQTKPREWSSR
jgi:hypothetical protein